MRLQRLVLLALAAFMLAGCGYNAIQSKDEAVKAAWSEVINQYQRRADLVPNLVNTVKGYAEHEQSTLEAVTNARAQVGKITLTADDLNDEAKMKAFQQAQGELSSALSRLMAVSENYPNLKADSLFQTLQAQLEGTENRIAVARRDYIEAVRVYNTSLRTFPTVLWAKFWYTDAKPFENFTISEDKMQTPKVDFGKKS